MTTKKILSVLLAVLMTLSLGVTALANSPVDENGWMYAPNSPAGLEDGDIWFDFTYLFSDEMTEDQKAAALAKYNSGDWYVNMAQHLVKCENGPDDLNGVYTRSQQPYILCIKEVGVSWVDVHKNLAGIQVGDYYLDEGVFRAVCADGFTDYFLAQAINHYVEENGEQPTDEQIAAMRTALEAQVEGNIVDSYWNGYGFSYNPNGTFYRYQLNMLPVPWGYYIVDGGIARQMMIIVDALDAALRVADEATVAASPWVRVAGSVDDAEAGGYYLDFDDTEAVRTAFNISEDYSDEQIAEDIAMMKSGEWYADLDRGVITGKIVLPAATIGADEDLVQWYPENAALFALLKVKPAAATEDPEPEEQSESIIQRLMKSIAAFFLRVVNFIKQVFGK